MDCYSKNQHHFAAERTEETPYKGANLGWCRMQKCVFLAENGNGVAKSCDYLLQTGHRRPCAAGPGCTALQRGEDAKMPKHVLKRT